MSGEGVDVCRLLASVLRVRGSTSGSSVSATWERPVDEVAVVHQRLRPPQQASNQVADSATPVLICIHLIDEHERSPGVAAKHFLQSSDSFTIFNGRHGDDESQGNCHRRSLHESDGADGFVL